MLAVLYVICFGAAGMIWGYIPSYGYMGDSLPHGGYAMDSIMSDNFESSLFLADRLTSDLERVKNMMSYGMSDSDIRDQVAEMPFYVHIGYWGNEYQNDIDAGGSVLRIDSDGVSGALSSRLQSIGFDRFNIDREGGYIEIGYSVSELSAMRAYWNEMRSNMIIIIVSEIVLLAFGTAFLVLSCISVSEDSSGNISKGRIFLVPYEITLTLAVLLGWLCVWLFSGGTGICSTMSVSYTGRTLYMFMCGLGNAACMFMVYDVFLCYSSRRKNGCAVRGSIIAVVLIWLWKCLKWLGGTLRRFSRFLREIFTGELYSAKTVAKKLIWLDTAIILITIVTAVVFVTLVGCGNAAALLCIVVEIVALGCFFYGRYLLIRDEALVEKQINEIYNGNYTYKPQLSGRSPYADVSHKLGEFSEQYRRGIEESVKAERMKMELVTNVSHDLKTPLTSIIGYIELLSKEELPPEAQEHVKILQSKSERLKNIVSDVFELAKTTSGEITVERRPLDLTKLSYQTLGEMEDRITSAGFDIKVRICEPPVTVISDGKRLYRIIQNLLDNALKYSLKGTRIYYSLDVRDGHAYIVIKNISAYEMTFTKEEILERFTRGDKARSSEGSGLGLSIAQGFTLACGGQFDIDIDGDMFKAIVSFPVAAVSTELTETVTADG